MQHHLPLSTENAHPWPILITSLLLVASLAGCASVKPLEVVTVPSVRTPLALAELDPLTIKPVTWKIITPGNAEAVFAEMEAKKQPIVLFAITDNGYEQLAITLADLRNYIAAQRTIVLKYKEYYEPVK